MANCTVRGVYSSMFVFIQLQEHYYVQQWSLPCCLWPRLTAYNNVIYRSRAQARVDDAQESGGNPSKGTGATATPTPAGLALSTPSTTHNSLRSSGSAGGLGLVNRAMSDGGGARVEGGHSKANGVVAVSVQSSHTESMSPPRGGTAVGGNGHPVRFVVVCCVFWHWNQSVFVELFLSGGNQKSGKSDASNNCDTCMYKCF